MSAFRHIDNIRVRPIEEELEEMGLDPDRVLSEIDRQTAMLEGAPPFLDPSGLREGDESPRSLVQYSATLLAEKCDGKGKGKKDKKADDDDDEEEDPADSEGMGEAIGGRPAHYKRAEDVDFKVLSFVGGHGGPTPSELSKELGIPVSEINDTVKRHHAGGFLVIRDGGVHLTKKGIAALKQVGAYEPGGRPYSYKRADAERWAAMGEETELSEASYQKRPVNPGKPYTQEHLRKVLVDAQMRLAGAQTFGYALVKAGEWEESDRRRLESDMDGVISKLQNIYSTMGEDLDSAGDPRLSEGVRQMVEDLGLDEEGTEAFLYLLGEGWELDEALGVVKKIKGAAARLAKRLRHREYMKNRGTQKRKAKIYRKTKKRQIKRTMAKKLRKYGRKGLEKLHKMGRRVVQKSWDERLANIQEELKCEAVWEQQDQEALEESVGELSIVAEAALNASETAWYLGEVFDAMGDEAGQVLFQLSAKALELAEAVDEAGEPTEGQEAHLETILSAVVRALAEYEEQGTPSLGEAIGIGMVKEGMGTWDELVEYKPPVPGDLEDKAKGKGVARGQKVPAGKTAGPDTSMAGKYLRAINIAMQAMDVDKVKAAALTVVKKHTVTDSKGKKVTAVKDMADVLRVMYYLSQITGLKAPAWMYRGKQKPWFVTSDDEEAPAKPSDDKKMADALKALGAPAGLLKALAAA